MFVAARLRVEGAPVVAAEGDIDPGLVTRPIRNVLEDQLPIVVAVDRHDEPTMRRP
jgi:hypothetical protein